MTLDGVEPHALESGPFMGQDDARVARTFENLCGQCSLSAAHTRLS
jgi:hypothetical protein